MKMDKKLSFGVDPAVSEKEKETPTLRSTFLFVMNSAAINAELFGCSHL